MEGGLLNSLLVILVKSDTRLEEGTYVLCVSMKWLKKGIISVLLRR